MIKENMKTALRRALYYLGYNPDLKPIIHTFEYSDKLSFEEAIKSFDKNTRIRTVFNFNEKISGVNLLEIFSCLTDSYDELLLQNISKLYIVGRKDETICLSNKSTSEEDDVAVLKLDAFFTEFFGNKHSSNSSYFYLFPVSLPIFVLGYLFFQNKKYF